jgi:hypothetical protein
VAESTLSINYSELLSEIGRYLGYTRDTTAWSTEERSDVDSVIKSGLRQFYVPPPLSANETSHSWAFLKPLETLTTEIDVDTYDLPDDFGGIDGDFSYEAGLGKQFIRVAGEGLVRNLQSTSNSSGVPSVAAIRPKPSDGTTGQRFEVVFWKKPNAAYVLSYRKLVLMNALSDEYPYPLGGMQHGETILESCLAVAEQRLNDGTKGTHWQTFMLKLAASVMYERRSFVPGFLGYNGDRSDFGGRTNERITIVNYDGARE